MIEKQYIIRRYTWRWLNLLLFVMYCINNGIHWAQYSVINDSISVYYNVPHAFVEWTSGLYALSYVFFVGPALYAMEKFKLRYIMIFASILSTTGAWMKMFSVVPDRFLLAFIAQFLISISYTFTFGGSARLIAAWFGVHETSRASALSFFGDQFGSAISFIIPIIIMGKTSDTIIWESNLRKMHLINAALSTLYLLLIILLYKDKPKNPPSMIQALKGEMRCDTMLQSLPKMFKNRAFLMLLFWYSACSGFLTTLLAVIGEVITVNFPNSYDDAGKIGFIIVTSAVFMSQVLGYFMDKTHKFKEVGIILTTGSFFSFLIFTIVLKMNNITYVYIASLLIGIFIGSVYVSSIQIGIEILYPISEDNCSGIMLFFMQLTSFIFLPIYGTILRNYGDTTVHSVFCGLIFAASVVAFLCPVKLNRQEAERLGANAKELQEFLPNSKQQIVKY